MLLCPRLRPMCFPKVTSCFRHTPNEIEHFLTVVTVCPQQAEFFFCVCVYAFFCWVLFVCSFSQLLPKVDQLPKTWSLCQFLIYLFKIANKDDIIKDEVKIFYSKISNLHVRTKLPTSVLCMCFAKWAEIPVSGLVHKLSLSLNEAAWNAQACSKKCVEVWFLGVYKAYLTLF